MSWVKKFQEGGKSTKQYGHLRINGIDLGNSEEMYNAFARHAQKQDIRQGKFYDQWLEMLRNGEDVELGNGNTVNAKPKDMSESRAGERSNWTRFWDDVFDTDRNQFSNAVATARRFNWAPLKIEETPASKKDFDTSTIKLNYNPDPKNKKRQTWSTTHANNARAEKRVADALAWMADPSKFDYNANENIAAAYSRANANGDPNTFAENIWNIMRNYQGLDFTDPDVQNALDWLNAFGIDVDRITVPSGGDSGGVTPAIKEYKGPDGKIYIADKDGNLTLKDGQGDAPVVKEENSVADNVVKVDPSKPTLITPEYAKQMGWDPKYNFGLIYGKNSDGSDAIYDPTNIPVELLPTMEYVTELNNRTDLTQLERNKLISDKLIIPGIEKYSGWTTDLTLPDLDFNTGASNLGLYSAAFSEITPQYELPTGWRGFKYYDNTTSGSNPWGFRDAKYLWFDETGKQVVNDNFDLNKRLNDENFAPQFIKKVDTWDKSKEVKRPRGKNNDGLYQLTKTFVHDESPIGNTPYELLMDKNGNYYIYEKPKGGGGLDKIFGRVREVTKDYANMVKSRNPKYYETTKSVIKSEGGKIDFNKINAFKKGGKVIKAQGGLSALDTAILQQINHLKSNDFTVRDNLGNTKWFNDTYSNFFQIPEVTDPNSGIISQVNTPVPDVKESTKVTDSRGPLQSQTPTISEDWIKSTLDEGKVRPLNKRYSLYSDYNLDSSPYITAGINAGLTALDYGSMAWGRKKIHDITERAIKDSIYKQTVPQLQTLPITTPLEDRLAKMYESHIGRMKLPQTSDAVTNTSLEFTDDAQAMQGLSQAVGQQSAKVTQLQQANQQTLNQQQQYYANAENDLRQRVAGAIMNLGQNDASLVAQTAQSIQNLAREWRTKFDNANQQFNLFQYQNKINELNRQAETDWLNQVQTAHPDIWKLWDAADQSKYDHDFNTWAMSQNGIWKQLEEEYRSNQEAISRAAGNAYLDLRLRDPFLKRLHQNRYATPYKSGGKVTTKRQNRYKNEPSEDIWIEQNKNTHRLVAKLNDNIIKTFLKTLK